MALGFLFADIGGEIVSAFGQAVATLFKFIPALLGAIIILLIGWIIARVARALVLKALTLIHFDQVMARTGLPELFDRAGVRADPARLLSGLVYWFLFLIFVVAAANALGVPTITAVITSIVLFLPNVFVAIVIMLIGMVLARFVADLVRGVMHSSNIAGENFVAGLARWSILAFAFILALDQLNISQAIVQTLFASVAGGLALGLALAFGLGGRDTAKSIVDSAYTSLTGRVPGNSSLGSGAPTNTLPPSSAI
ncbi:MAG TPA: hypothetical protein VF792_07525 [Ktedonobacterales bacterium]